MGNRQFVYAHEDTVGGAGITVTGKWGGFVLNGSGGGSTITVKDGTVTVYATSAGADVQIPLTLAVPVAFTGGIVASISGTGFYSVLYTT